MKKIIGFIYSELLILIRLISPVYLTVLCTQTLSIIALISAGHIGDGKTELAAVSLCQVFVDITGYYLHFAIASALDTLASQAFGARRFKYLGVILQRSVLIHLCISLPISIFWLNMGNILIVMHQSREVVSLANKYMFVSICINPAYALLIPCMKILQTQDIVLPSAVIVMLGNLVEGLLCYLLVYRAGLGVSGIALSQLLTIYLMAFATMAYLHISGVWSKIWDGMSWEAWLKWGQYIYYGIPELATILIEIPCIQMGGFVVGVVSTQPEVAISIYSILTYLDLFVFMTPISLSTITAIRVGNLIGEGKLTHAKKVGILVVILQIILSLIQSTVLMAFRSIWGEVFTTDQRVVSGLSHLVILVAIYHPFDSLVVVFQGILRGVGKQDLGLITAFGFCIVAFPVSMGLSIGLKLSTLGYWLGIMTGYLVRALLWLSIPICCIKWSSIRSVEENESNIANETSESVLEDTNLINRSSQEDTSISSQQEIFQNYVRFLSAKEKLALLWCKILFVLLGITIFILMLGCKLSENRVTIYVTESYMQEPLEVCCFQFLALNKTSN